MPSANNPATPPLSAVLPPLIFGTATFNYQYNTDPHNLPTTAIVHRALSVGVKAFDTSPYYGPAEEILGMCSSWASSSLESSLTSVVRQSPVHAICRNQYHLSPRILPHCHKSRAYILEPIQLFRSMGTEIHCTFSRKIAYNISRCRLLSRC